MSPIIQPSSVSKLPLMINSVGRLGDGDGVGLAVGVDEGMGLTVGVGVIVVAI